MKVGFFDHDGSLGEDDFLYSSEEFNRLLSSIFYNGIFPDMSGSSIGSFVVEKYAAKQDCVSIGPGRALINGLWVANDSQEILKGTSSTKLVGYAQLYLVVNDTFEDRYFGEFDVNSPGDAFVPKRSAQFVIDFSETPRYSEHYIRLASWVYMAGQIMSINNDATVVKPKIPIDFSEESESRRLLYDTMGTKGFFDCTYAPCENIIDAFENEKILFYKPDNDLILFLSGYDSSFFYFAGFSYNNQIYSSVYNVSLEKFEPLEVIELVPDTKVTQYSRDDHFVSAKCVYTELQDIKRRLDELEGD